MKKKAFSIIFKGLSLKQVKIIFIGRWESDFNLITHQPDIDKIHLQLIKFIYKNPYNAKYQMLISEREDAGIKVFNDYEAFIE